MIDFKKKQQMEQIQSSSEHIENDALTITYENLPSEDWYETKVQSNFDKPDQSFEQIEE